jgi:hypothetical protein
MRRLMRRKPAQDQVNTAQWAASKVKLVENHINSFNFPAAMPKPCAVLPGM